MIVDPVGTALYLLRERGWHVTLRASDGFASVTLGTTDYDDSVVVNGTTMEEALSEALAADPADHEWPEVRP